MNLAPRAGRAVVTEVYEDCSALVRRIARRHARKYHQDFDEALAQASLLFLEAYHTLDPSRGDLYRRIQFYVTKRLIDGVRREAERANRLKRVRTKPESLVLNHTPEFDFGALTGGLSPDGRTAVSVVFDDPLGLLSETENDRRRTDSRGGRRYVRRRLADLGWTGARIDAAFAEIREALS